MRSATLILAAAAAAALAGSASAMEQHCDPSYDCEYFYESPAHGLVKWNLRPLCSPTFYEHIETDRPETSFTFNVCGLSSQRCGPPQNQSATPVFGVAIQNLSNDTCVIAGEGFPIFQPLDTDNPITGGINITHTAAPQDETSPFACPAKPNGELVSRQVKYMMNCDPNVPTIETDFAIEESECSYVISMRSAAACGVPNDAPGGNCKAPPQPTGLSNECKADNIALIRPMLGPNAAFAAVNQECYDTCDFSAPENCEVDCRTDIDSFTTSCGSNNGAVVARYSIQATYDPATPGGDARAATAAHYVCMPATCNNQDDLHAFDNYFYSHACGYAAGVPQLQTCGVAIEPPQPNPSPASTPSSTPKPAAPSASSTPLPGPVYPSTTPPPARASVSPSPGAAPSGGDNGGAVAAGIFGTAACLAAVVFGGYHAGTRMGWMRRESVPSSARGCLECACLGSAASCCAAGTAGPASASTGFGTSGGTFGTGSAAAPSTSGGGFGSSGTGRSSGGGYQTI
ncbi:hypothetical protein FNF31_04141 [Cafeteria roenbergensis]|uniref:MRH domain-containing protein n=1 Tax=Cafeteria roenbergensis TaxID=33653 RepID=A0A5A8C2M3_CAFRO|nr:hypothetical protein FNF28_07731 [Cafeteria roenbergensis]KAA0160757.1 hypothetical protein FNF31_04141 [Cafeteria roenbergensis]